MSRTTRSFAVASLLLSLSLLAGPAAAADRLAFDDGKATFVPGQVLVKWRAGATANARRAAVSLRAHTVREDDLYLGDVSVVTLRAGQLVESAVAAYRDDPNVESVQPNYVYRATRAPNDPSYGQLWGLKNTGQTVTADLTQPPGTPLGYTSNNPGIAGNDINAELAWNAITDCSGVVVAVVDTGVNYRHADLAAAMWTSAAYPNHGYNFVGNDTDPMDRNGHGTHVAGTIGAVGNDGIGVAGVCWKASIMAVQVLNSLGTGETTAIVNGIDFAVNHGAKVINMSLGRNGPIDPLFEAAIIRALNADVVVVVAAGNDGHDNDQYSTWPCNFPQPNVICVAALDQKYDLAGFSNYGPTKVMIGAPGTNVVSAWPGTNSTSSDNLGSGWTFSTTTSGGWAYRPIEAVPGSANLVDPPDWYAGLYKPNTDDRVYKLFTTGQVDVVTLGFKYSVNVTDGDYFNVAFRWGESLADPFSGGKTVLSVTNTSTLMGYETGKVDLSGCRSPSCSIGFQLKTGNAGAAKGLNLGGFGLDMLTLNTGSYNTINGTSMATPMVAGVVTMLRAYNPRYGYADVVTALREGGRPVASLGARTSTGKAVDAIGTIRYIQPPTGVTVTVQ